MSAEDPRRLQSLMQAAAPDVELGFKPMFGGIMAYAGGQPFASLSNVGLALKFTGDERDEALAFEGTKPLRYKPESAASKTYVVLPPAIVNDPERLHDWIVRSAGGLKPKVAGRKPKS